MQKNETVHFNLFIFFNEIADVYFTFFIKCTVVQLIFLRLEKIFLGSVSLCVVFVWEMNDPLNLLCKCLTRYK